MELSGTKELIFDTFVQMTSELGYENVSMRDISEKVGIKVASIYNHFATKDAILKYAYDYYSVRQYDNRRSVDVMKKMIETADMEEFVPSLFFTFESEDQKKYVRMILITKIIYMRLFQDPEANKVFAEGNRNNLEYVISILKHGIDAGRLDPGFDFEMFADVLISAMQIMGIKAFAKTDYRVGQLDQEKRILALLARLLSSALK